VKWLLVTSSAIAFSAFAYADEPAQPLFYQDPDGRPFYAAGPKKTGDGKDYVAIFKDGPAAATASPPANHRVLYYRNPMGLPDTSPNPKKDSMGMEYLPVYSDEGTKGDSPGTVRITSGRLQTLGVRTEAAEMRVMAGRAIHMTGIVQFDERRLATVTTKVSGWIEHLAVAATGDPVRRGQVLAEIYSPDLVASEEEYLVAARMGAAMGSASLQRLRSLDIPEAEISRLRKTGQSSRRIAIIAPTDGVVIDKPVQQGMRINAGDALYRTADLASVWLIAQAQEQDIGSVAPGQTATATFVAFPDRIFEGKVEFIYPSLSADTRTVPVRIAIPNADGALRAAMFANATLEPTGDRKKVLSVPNSAVLDSGSRQVVLVDRGEGRFEPRRVHLGTRGDDWVQVTDGIAPGDRVVIGANFLIDAESNLRAALQGFTQGSKQ
jgi:Cu(I)/Ag(I) efflux system membrane fusion protein